MGCLLNPIDCLISTVPVSWWVIGIGILVIALLVLFRSYVVIAYEIFGARGFAAIGAAILTGLAYIAGRQSGISREREARKADEAEAAKIHKEVSDEVQTLSDDDVRKRLDKWVRK